MDRTAPPLIWSVTLGFALGGFFDGILLHQILQWHHLLSLVPAVDSLRGQILWDGLFHAFHYVAAAVGLWGLWRHGMPAGARLLGALLLGFGLWHLVDTLLSHWLLGIHRIRLDVDNPLAWDLLWLALFGLLPFAISAWLLRRDDGGAGTRRGLAALAILAVGAGAWAMRAPPGQPYTLAVFRPGLAPAAIESGIESLGGRVVWAGPALDVALIDLPRENRWSLYARGAILVSGAGAPPGCAAWAGVTS